MNFPCQTRCCDKCGKSTPLFAMLEKQVYNGGNLVTFQFCGRDCAEAFYIERLRRLM